MIDTTMRSLLEEDYIPSSPTYISNIDRLPVNNFGTNTEEDFRKSVNLETEYRNSITKDILKSICIVNNEEGIDPSGSKYRYTNISAAVPDMRPLLYLLERVKVMLKKQLPTEVIARFIIKFRHTMKEEMCGNNIECDDESYMDSAVSFFRGGDEISVSSPKMDKEEIVGYSNSIIGSVKEYINQYNACIHMLFKIIGKMNKHEEDKKRKKIICKLLVKTALKYIKRANILYALKADSLTQFVGDTCKDRFANEVAELWTPYKSVLEASGFSEDYDDFVMEQTYSSQYQNNATLQYAVAVMNEAFDDIIDSMTEAMGTDNKDDKELAANDGKDEEDRTDGTGGSKNILGRIWDKIKSLIKWIKNFITGTSKKFKEDTAAIIKENSEWITKERQSLINNAKNSTLQVSLHDYDTGQKRILDATKATFKTTQDAFVTQAKAANGKEPDTKETNDKLAKELIPDYDPQKEDSFVSFLNNYFVGGEETYNKNIANLDITGIINTVLNGAYIATIIGANEKAVNDQVKKVEQTITNSDLKKNVKVRGSVTPEQPAAKNNTETKKQESFTYQDIEVLKHFSEADQPTGGQQPSAGSGTGTKVEPPAETSGAASNGNANKNAAAQNNKTTYSFGANAHGNETNEELVAIYNYNKSALTVKSQLMGAAYNAYRKQIIACINVLKLCRGGNKENNAGNGNATGTANQQQQPAQQTQEQPAANGNTNANAESANRNLNTSNQLLNNANNPEAIRNYLQNGTKDIL